MKARWAVLVASVLLLFAVACGGSDKGSLLSGNTGTASSDKAPAATDAVKGSESASGNQAGQMFGGDKSNSHAGSSTGSTGDKPAALGDTFKSASNQYSMQYPKDWTSKANAASLGGVQIDGFLSADTVDGFTTNVNVLCDKQGAGESVDDYMKENVAQLQQQKITAKDAGKAQDGQRRRQDGDLHHGFRRQQAGLRPDCTDGQALRLGANPDHAGRPARQIPEDLPGYGSYVQGR